MPSSSQFLIYPGSNVASIVRAMGQDGTHPLVSFRVLSYASHWPPGARRCHLHGLYYSCWQREAWVHGGNSSPPSSWWGVATVLLGSVLEQSCGVCVFIGVLLFTDPTLHRWIGGGHLQTSVVLRSVVCRRVLWAVCPTGQGKWLDCVVHGGQEWTARGVVRGTQGCCDGVGSCLVSRSRRLGILPQYHCIVCWCFLKTTHVGRRRLHLQTLLTPAPKG